MTDKYVYLVIVQYSHGIKKYKTKGTSFIYMEETNLHTVVIYDCKEGASIFKSQYPISVIRLY